MQRQKLLSNDRLFQLVGHFAVKLLISELWGGPTSAGGTVLSASPVSAELVIHLAQDQERAPLPSVRQASPRRSWSIHAIIMSESPRTSCVAKSEGTAGWRSSSRSPAGSAGSGQRPAAPARLAQLTG